jgi:hypothetical protein
MADWRAIAAAQGVEIPDSALERLASLEAALKPLKGLLDWKEEPALVFPVDAETEAGEAPAE